MAVTSPGYPTRPPTVGAAIGPHSGPYDTVLVGSAVRTINLAVSQVAEVMIKAIRPLWRARGWVSFVGPSYGEYFHNRCAWACGPGSAVSGAVSRGREEGAGTCGLKNPPQDASTATMP